MRSFFYSKRTPKNFLTSKYSSKNIGKPMNFVALKLCIRCNRFSGAKLATLAILLLTLSNNKPKALVRQFVRARKLIGGEAYTNQELHIHLILSRIIFHWLCSRTDFSYMHHKNFLPSQYSIFVDGIFGISYLRYIYSGYDWLKLPLYGDSYPSIHIRFSKASYFEYRDYLNLFGLPCYKYLN